ncbi:MAG: DUF1566 domain-containing protein [Nitrospira sp.]|nr:DUF1566 domain-containing protein [Nitrospira sp.]
MLTAFTNAAVRDNNTGLVWEQSPQAAAATWSDARFTCANKIVGGQKGWRLPSIPELASLVDPAVSAPPTLPPGHPFTNVQSARYWSASADAFNPSNAWLVFFFSGSVGATPKNFSFQVWCVRGGMHADQY